MKLKVAIPLRKKNYCMHFGESDEFVIYEIAGVNIISQNFEVPPPHDPGTYPIFLIDKGVTDIIAGGMGKRALAYFKNAGMNVHLGVRIKSPDELIHDLINQKLEVGINECSH